jgi:hypothetical protein
MAGNNHILRDFTGRAVLTSYTSRRNDELTLVAAGLEPLK